jgi:hypothetical protein
LVYAAVVVLGFVVGVVVGRWWALVAAIIFGAWIWSESTLEVSAWFIGSAYAGIAAAGIAAGVLLRKFVAR